MVSRSRAASALLLGAALLLPATGVVVAQSPEPVTITTPTTLLTPGTLVDCVDIEYPPMEYFPSADVTDPAQAIGFDVDGARALAAKLGLTLEIRNTAFDALIPDLTAGRCDIVWTGLYVNETRLEVADAHPYMATGQVVMVAKGNAAGIAAPEDLCGKTVAFQSGGVVEERVNAVNAECTAAGKEGINLQGYKTVAEEFQQIIVGRVDAIWETDSSVSDWMIRNPDQYEVAYALPRDDTYGVYYPKGNTELGDAIRAGLLALKEDGTLAAIAETYEIDPTTLDVIQ